MKRSTVILVAFAFTCAAAAAAFGKTVVVETQQGAGQKAQKASIALREDGERTVMRSATEQAFPRVQREGDNRVITMVPYWFGTEATARQLPSGAVEVTFEGRKLERTHSDQDGTVSPIYSSGGFSTVISLHDAQYECVANGLKVCVRIVD